MSSYTKPKINPDGSVDILSGPNEPKDDGNWIKTGPGKGWFPISRFYSPTEAFFDKTWALNDIEPLQARKPMSRQRSSLIHRETVAALMTVATNSAALLGARAASPTALPQFPRASDSAIRSGKN